MENAGTCCGMGGSFNIAHYDLSLKILEKKLQSLENSGAETLVTGCMGCMLQFMDGVYQKEKNTRVMHLVEMLDQYLP
jgi:glycolate oxidase iron-sulfur subunit